jgi:RNA polymerase primary sigma factor
MDSAAFSAVLSDQGFFNDASADISVKDPNASLTEEREVELYGHLEGNLLELVRVISPVGFFQMEYIRSLTHILGKKDDVKRIFFLTEEAESDLQIYLPMYLGRLRLLMKMLTYTWERIYNDPVLCKFFRMDSDCLPIVWKTDKYEINVEGLNPIQIDLLQKYCDLNYSFYQMVVRIPLDAIYLRNLVDRSIRRLEKFKFLREDSLKHAEALRFYPDSLFHKEKLFVLRTQLQMMHVSFRVFPLEVERLLLDFKSIGRKITSLTSELFQGSFPLVRLWANKYCKKLAHSGLDFHDLCQEGRLGLMKALYRFDYRRGNRFSTYATYWVKHYMRLFVTANAGPMAVPIHQVQNVKVLNDYKQQFQEDHSRLPTDDEICGGLKWEAKMLYQVKNSTPFKVSFDAPINVSDSEGQSVGDYMADDIPDPGAMLENEDLRLLIIDAIKQLKPKFAGPMFDYMGLTPEGDVTATKSMADIAIDVGISRQGVSQRIKKGQETIRPILLSTFREYYSKS